MKHLAIIPARSGSKGLPDKNIKPLCGKPLLAWSIEAAVASGLFDTVHVSTDSEAYAGIARQYGAGVPFLRNVEASSDTASSWDAVREVLDKYERLGKIFDTIALLQPTSPLRTAEDICGAYQLMREKAAKAVVSVCEADHSPLWCNTLPESLCMDGFVRAAASVSRQALPPYYRINGAVYILTVPAVLEQGGLIYDADTYACIMPKNRSIDIDSLTDFRLAEILLTAARGVRGGGTYPLDFVRAQRTAARVPVRGQFRAGFCHKPCPGFACRPSLSREEEAAA